MEREVEEKDNEKETAHNSFSAARCLTYVVVCFVFCVILRFRNDRCRESRDRRSSSKRRIADDSERMYSKANGKPVFVMDETRYAYGKNLYLEFVHPVKTLDIVLLLLHFSRRRRRFKGSKSSVQPTVFIDGMLNSRYIA